MSVLDTYTKDPDSTLDYTIRWGAAAWVASTAYKRYSWVWNALDGLFYQCLTPHTSQAAFASDQSKWKKKGDLWLDPQSSPVETVTAVVWTVPAGLTNENDTDDGYSATIWLSGGTVEESYTVACKVTTNSTPEFRIGERSITITVEQK